MRKINKKSNTLNSLFLFKKGRSNLYKAGISLIFPVLFLILAYPQISMATVYQPGETLEPDCAPGSIDCGVAIFSLNGEDITTQTLVSGISGTDFNIVSGLGIHTFNTPSASALNRGLLTSSDWSTFNAKLSTVNNSNWSGTGLSVENGGTGTTNGSITGTGALSFTSDTTNALTLDSGTTGDINIGTNANDKTINFGNTTGTTAVNINSGTEGISFIAGPTSSSSNIRIGNSATATPDLLVLDNGTDDPTGVNGGIYYNTSTNKFRCFENDDWVDCVVEGAGSDLLHAASYDTNEAITNVPTGGAQVTLGTVSVTPTTATGDVYVAGWVDVLSNNGTDQPLLISIETTSNCTGNTVGNASVTYTITAAASNNGLGSIRVSGIAVDPGASSHSYSLCAAVTSGAGNSDIRNWGIEALVIDTGADLAEIYTTNDESLEAGDVVSLDSSLKTGVKKSSGAGDRSVIGIVSTRPGMLIGGVDNEGVQAIPVALSGRVPVKVTTENGAIEPGDYLSPSSTPGVAMKSSGTGPVIGQAMSAYDNEGIGIVMAFVNNFDLGEIGQVAVLMGDISPLFNADGSDNGLSILITTIQAETSRNPVVIIGQKISDSKQFLTDFVSARVTAIRGYFDELFTKKVHTEELCIKKSDGNEVCVDGDDLNSFLPNVVYTDEGSADIVTVEEEILLIDEEPDSLTEEETLPVDEESASLDEEETPPVNEEPANPPEEEAPAE